MAVYIIKIFLRSPNLFGTFNTDMWSEKGWDYNNQNLAKAYYSANLLTDGEEVPNGKRISVTILPVKEGVKLLLRGIMKVKFEK